MSEPADAPRPRGLYVHFPFCIGICPYCDFVVYGGRAAQGEGNQIERVVEALAREIRLRGAATAATAAGPALETVYLGGGTPSLMAARQVERLLTAIDGSFGIAGGAEITLEANPGPDERGDMNGFRACGVNRLSIGAQSLEAAELRSLGRRHSAADVAATVDDARKAGFDNVSLDLLYDIPGQTTDSWRATLGAALALSVDHVSAYALTLDEAPEPASAASDHLPPSAGALRWRGRARAEQDEDRATDLYEIADDCLAAAGLAWYELSNWSRRGRQSRHNLNYWSGGPWEAVGPGAHAFDGLRTRRWNAARLDGYLAALLPADGSDSRLPPGGRETADARTARAESVLLALRTSHGVSPAVALKPEFSAAFAWAAEHGMTETATGRLRLTRRGRLLSNEIFARLLPETRSGAADGDRIQNRLAELEGSVPIGDRATKKDRHDALGSVEQVQLQAPG
jgi:oxygen-independent coproporphyrinogen-3 oxidase